MAETHGTKYTCYACQTRFYDLNRPEPVCPRCGANQKSQPKAGKAPSGRSRAAERVKEEVYVPSTDEEDMIEGGAVAEDDGDSGADEDAEEDED